MTPVLLALALAAAPGVPDATALLRDADRARGGLRGGVSWDLSIESVEDGETTRRSMRVRAARTDALAETLDPPRHKGEVYLFNERVLWFMKPGLRRPIAMSTRQRLQGEASNGDICATNYAADYRGTVIGEDVVDGVATWKLDLVAASPDVTYDRIRYWISKRSHLGVKAEFLTVAGDLFKSATFTYGNRVTIASGEVIDFVSRMTIQDAMGAGGVTTLVYARPRVEAHAASMFNVNNLVR